MHAYKFYSSVPLTLSGFTLSPSVINKRYFRFVSFQQSTKVWCRQFAGSWKPKNIIAIKQQHCICCVGTKRKREKALKRYAVLKALLNWFDLNKHLFCVLYCIPNEGLMGFKQRIHTRKWIYSLDEQTRTHTTHTITYQIDNTMCKCRRNENFHCLNKREREKEKWEPFSSLGY